MEFAECWGLEWNGSQIGWMTTQKYPRWNTLEDQGSKLALD